jgi:hypothetical protein
MGRYAFFNTELEYKFRFGIQPSEDIRVFGGINRWDLATPGNKHHEWEQRDMAIIYKELEILLLDYIVLNMPDFEQYDSTLEGTSELKLDLYEYYNKTKSIEDERTVARFILGSLIYHQLLYKEKLLASYEE